MKKSARRTLFYTHAFNVGVRDFESHDTENGVETYCTNNNSYFFCLFPRILYGGGRVNFYFLFPHFAW